MRNIETEWILCDYMISHPHLFLKDTSDSIIQARYLVGEIFGYVQAQNVPIKDLFELAVDIVQEKV